MSPAVTVVVQHLGPVGGMERQCTELVHGYLAAGWSVTVVARVCELEPHPSLRFVRVPGPYRPFALGFPWFFGVAGFLTWRHRRGLLHVNGAIVPNRADLATVHFAHRAYARLKAPRTGSRPTRLHTINARAVGMLARAAERWCYRPARIPHLVGISDGLAREVVRQYPYGSDEVTVIPYGVDRGVFRPDPAARARVRSELLGARAAEASVVLFVGGDWGRKGLGAVIGALAEAPGWELVVIGEGDELTARADAARAGVSRRVHLLGRRPLPADMYASADAFCLPTSYETFCLVAHEAAAAGLPLLVTRVSGVEDLLVDGENGWFVTRDPADVAGRLRALRDDPGAARQMGEAARRATARYGWDIAVKAHLALYDRLRSGVADRSTGPGLQVKSTADESRPS